MRRVGLVSFGVSFALACGGPTSPRGPVDPPPVQTAPSIRSISVPLARVEAGQDIAIAAVVEDAETPVAQLAYQWTASAGTITGGGASATWRLPRGITAGINVTVTLTVTETYEVIENLRLVTKQHIVSSTSSGFRVHDSEAETKELARKFLVDLFGRSSVPPSDCLVDFAAVCATVDGGYNQELDEIINHRNLVVIDRATVLAQRIAMQSTDFGSVHSAMLYDEHWIDGSPKAPACGDFQVTVIYVEGRWWICQSFYNEEDQSHCPVAVDNSAARLMRSRGRGTKAPSIR